MINYEEMEQATLFGIEELFNQEEYIDDNGWFENEQPGTAEWQGPAIAEALYAEFSGLSKWTI